MPHELRRAAVSACLALSIVAGAGTPARLHGQPSPKLLGMVGDWRDSVGDHPIIVVNGARWRGASAIDSLRARSLRVFGRADSTLLAHWTAPEAFPVAVALIPGAFTDGTVRVQFNMLGGQSDQIAGIMFGLQPSGEYHYVRYNTKDGNIAVWHYTGGQRKRVKDGTTHRQLPLNSWHELVLSVRGTTVHAAVTGDTTLSVTHDFTAPLSGAVGLWVKRDAVTAFRGFRVDVPPK